MSIKNIIFFLSGVVVGSGITVFVCNSMYKEKLEKQANDIHAFYTNNKPTTVQEAAPVKEEKNNFTKTYNEIISQHNYANISVAPVKKPVQGMDIYVVSKDFAGRDGYELQPETYDHWANDVLTDASGRPLSTAEIDRLVGINYADHLREVDDDTFITYFRNEALGIDIEIYDNGEEEYHDPVTVQHDD